jgi:hypothetical protein
MALPINQNDSELETFFSSSAKQSAGDQRALQASTGLPEICVNSDVKETSEEIKNDKYFANDESIIYNESLFCSFKRKIFVIDDDNSAELLKHSIIEYDFPVTNISKVRNHPMFYKKNNAIIFKNFINCYDTLTEQYKYIHMIIDDTCFITITNKTCNKQKNNSLYYLYENTPTLYTYYTVDANELYKKDFINKLMSHVNIYRYSYGIAILIISGGSLLLLKK